MLKKTMKYWKKHFLHCGDNTYIYNPFCISHPEKITIGDNTKILDNARISIYADTTEQGGGVTIGNECYIGYYLSLLVKDKVTIGNNVLIASNVIITSENHGINPESNIPYMDQPLAGEEVTIGDGTWVGEKVCILSGVHIGKKCVIGAGSVVTKDIPDYCIAVGNPAKVIKKYDFDLHSWKLV